MVWMFIDDNDDDFKVYQKTFRKMEVETAKAKLEDAVAEVKEEQKLYFDKLGNSNIKNGDLNMEKSCRIKNKMIILINVNFQS